jgi:hypothetical protein
LGSSTSAIALLFPLEYRLAGALRDDPLQAQLAGLDEGHGHDFDCLGYAAIKATMLWLGLGRALPRLFRFKQQLPCQVLGLMWS